MGRRGRIADAAARRDGGVLAELGTELRDVHIHCPPGGITGLPPHGGQELLPGKDTARLRHEVREEVEFGGRQGEFLGSRACGPVERIQFDAAQHERFGTWGSFGPAQDRLDPRH